MVKNTDLTDINYITRLLQSHGFKFSKSLGQNFLVDSTVCPKMAELCGCAGAGVIEIGPGIGVLTAELAKIAEKVVAIELDRRLEPVLQQTLSGCENVEIIFDDIMKLDLEKLIKEHFDGMQVYVCANLPYYITSPIIMMLLESKLPIDGITVMVQKEAAERICAQMGTRECGAVSAAVSYYSHPEELFFVGRECFMPSPKVDSCVIRLTPHKNPPVLVKNEKNMFKIVKAAFCMRRKTLCNSLSSGLSMDKAKIADALCALELPSTARPEELSLQQFASLCDELY